jgi:DNA-binding beta-propeller fold protein YncE
MPDASQFTQIKRLQTSAAADQNAGPNKFRAPRFFDGWNPGQLIKYGSNALSSNKFRPIFESKWFTSTFFNSVPFVGAAALAVDTSGNVYAGFSTSNILLKLSPAGQVLITSTVTPVNALAIREPFLYISAGTTIERRNISDLTVNNTGYSNITLGASRSVAINTAGTHIFYVDASTSRLNRAPIVGGVSSGTTKFISAAEINNVQGLTIRSFGGIDYAFVTENGTRAVIRYNVSDVSAGSPIIPKEQFVSQPYAANSFGGDGLFRTDPAVRLNNPTNIAFDPAGNLYIADAGNNRVRRVDANTGIITTFAGFGPASSTGDGGDPLLASFNSPRSIAFSPDGSTVYVAEFSSTTSDIRAITLRTYRV